MEIERKIPIKSMPWGSSVSSRRIEQGYLFISEERTVRARCSEGQYTLAIKVKGEGLGCQGPEANLGLKLEQYHEMLAAFLKVT